MKEVFVTKVMNQPSLPSDLVTMVEKLAAQKQRTKEQEQYQFYKRSAALATVLPADRIADVQKALSSLDDEEFSIAIESFKIRNDIESRTTDLTREILLAKYAH